MKKKYNIDINIRGNMTNGKVNENAFDYTFEGYWLGDSDNYCLSSDDKVNLGIDFKPGTAFTVQDKTLYRFPKLDLPRQKVELLKEKYNCKVIRNSDKADIHIVSDQLFDNLFEYQWTSSVTSISFYKMLVACKASNFLTEGAITHCKSILENVGTDAMVKINLAYSYHNADPSMEKMRDDIQELIQENSSERKRSRDIMLSMKNYDDYLRIINSNATIVYDTDIIGIIDGELAILDNTELEATLKMVKNHDIENRTLALEMLANCNIEKSFDVVSHSFYWCYDYLKNTNNWNTVNVKALRKRLKKYQGGACNTTIYAYNNYVKCLIEDKKLTKFALDNTSLDSVKLKDELLDNLIKEESDEQEIRHSGNDNRDHFTI